MNERNNFVLNVLGDKRELLNAVREYDWGSLPAREIYWNNLLSSIQRLFDDDPDSPVTMSADIDGLDQLAELIRRWMPLAQEISLWASGDNDQAQFETGLIYRDGKHSLAMPRCASRLKSKEGKLAQIARGVYETLHEEFKLKE